MLTIPFDVNDRELRDTFLRQTLFDALAGLQCESRPGWGMMTPQQMVEHLGWAFELSTGQARVDSPVSEMQRKKLKTFLYDNRATPHEFMNPVLAVGLPPLRHAGLADAKASLRVEADRFVRQARTNPGVTHTHPVFGSIGMEEWARSHFKHAYHHLLQFSLVGAA